MANKNQKEFTSEISKQKYTFQKVAPMEWLDMMDEIEATEKNRRRKMYGLALENIVVQPKKPLEEWEDFAELDEVVTAALRFQRGQ